DDTRRYAAPRFEFELRPVAEVAPWGGEQPVLHWFGLTDGWFRISAGDEELLRYHDETVRRGDLQRPYPDYYVARLWEDLIVLRWVLTEPVPADLVPFVDGTFARRELPDAEPGDEADAAFRLQGDLHLDLGYLTDPPALRCRQAGDGSVTLSRRITGDTFAGPPWWDVTVPAAEFFAAIEDFDRRFIAVMADRVAELERTGPPPGVELDLVGLRHEHEQRATWLRRRLAEPRTVDWAAVRAGYAEIATWPIDE
ncbi:MAG TPA: DUF5984 family protein, partial [Actinoplanes sp.]|nr:DUF5984 family protein [Actinoplanes sp.]